MTLKLPNATIELDDFAIDFVRKVYEKVKQEDLDWFVVIAGGEGVGKSTFAINLFSLWCYLANLPIHETLTRTLIYDEDEFIQFLSTINPDEHLLPILLDEGANILFHRESMQKKRQYVLKFFNVISEPCGDARIIHSYCDL